MAQVKFFRGAAASYNAAKHADAIYFATDSHELILNEVSYGLSDDNAALLNNAITGVEWVSPDTLRFTRGEGKAYVEAVFPSADESTAGLMAVAHVVKLKGIEEGAQVNDIESISVDGFNAVVDTVAKTATITAGFALAKDVYTKEEVFTKDEITEKLSAVYDYKGTVATYEDLPTSGVKKGDVYNVEAGHDLYPAGTNWAWDGSKWDALGGLVDLSGVEKKISDNTTAIGVNAQAIADEAARADAAEKAIRADLGEKTATEGNTAFGRIAVLESELDALVGSGSGSGSVANQINAAVAGLKGTASVDFDTLGELEAGLKAEIKRAGEAEVANANAISAEQQRAEGKEAELLAAIQSNDTDIKNLQDADAAMAEDIAENLAAINKLNGADTVEGSVKKQIKDAVEALDATVGAASVAEGKHVAVQVVETDGVITAVNVAESDIASEAAVNLAIENEAKARAAQDDKIEAAIGLATDGSHIDPQGNYTSGATTIAEEIAALDTQAKVNADAIAAEVKKRGEEITRVEGLISDEAATRLAEDNKLAGRISTLEGYFGEGDNTVADQIADAVAGLKQTVDAYTVNNKKISENPVLDGSDIALTNYAVNANGFIAATDTVNAAIAKLENDLIWHEA